MLAGIVRRWRYGRDIVVVTGLPRSGTSMMMRMLEAGGLEVVTDGRRVADEDNPRGYYELERVKELDKGGDKAWVSETRGKVLKVISHLLEHLPDDSSYRVLFMRRDLDEVIASQNRMLVNRQETNPVSDERAKQAFRKHIVQTKVRMRTRANFVMLEVHYRNALDEPRAEAERVARFLGGGLDVERMAGVVEARLYRNQAQKLNTAAEPPA